MATKTSLLDNSVARTLVLFVALLIIGLVTRFPALQFPQLYALHGVFAAPFFSALALWHFNRAGNVGSLFVAVLGLAAVLGSMSLVMGLSFLALAVCLLVFRCVLGKMNPARRDIACAVLFGALDYPCALVVGIASGSYVGTPEATPIILLLAAVAVGLSLLAALLLAKEER